MCVTSAAMLGATEAQRGGMGEVVCASCYRYPHTKMCRFCSISLRDVVLDWEAPTMISQQGNKMVTSAHALNKLLSAIYRHPKLNDRFTVALAETLGLEGADAEPEAVRHLFLLVKQVRADIEVLPVDENAKKLAQGYINAFSGLDSFSQVSMNVDQAKKHFLKPDNLVGLTNLDMAFSGIVQFNDISEEAKGLAQTFRDSRQEVADSTIDPVLKEVLLRRLSQIIAALEHYYFFREDGLAEIMQGLVGTLVLSNKQDHEAAGILKKVASTLWRLASTATKTNKFLGDANGTVQNGLALLDTFKSMGE